MHIKHTYTVFLSRMVRSVSNQIYVVAGLMISSFNIMSPSILVSEVESAETREGTFTVD